MAGADFAVAAAALVAAEVAAVAWEAEGHNEGAVHNRYSLSLARKLHSQIQSHHHRIARP